MKPIQTLRNAATAALAAVSLSSIAAPTPAPAPAAAKPVAPKSTFAMPAAPAEGRDPFFPNSPRPYQTGVAPKANNAAPLAEVLFVKTIMPSSRGAFAVINNHTFAPGEDGTVKTSDGRFITIHCVDVNMQTGDVTIEYSGARTVLHFIGNR